MVRHILGAIAGTLIGGVLIGLVETIGHQLFPTAPIDDLTEFANVMALMPLEAKVWVLLAWGVGIFGGGLVALLISKTQTWPAWAVATLLFGGAVWTMFQFPHPPWMIVGCVVVTLSAALGAIRIMGPKA